MVEYLPAKFDEVGRGVPGFGVVEVEDGNPLAPQDAFDESRPRPEDEGARPTVGARRDMPRPMTRVPELVLLCGQACIASREDVVEIEVSVGQPGLDD